MVWAADSPGGGGSRRGLQQTQDFHFQGDRRHQHHHRLHDHLQGCLHIGDLALFHLGRFCTNLEQVNFQGCRNIMDEGDDNPHNYSFHALTNHDHWSYVSHLIVESRIYNHVHHVEREALSISTWETQQTDPKMPFFSPVSKLLGQNRVESFKRQKQWVPVFFSASWAYHHHEEDKYDHRRNDRAGREVPRSSKRLCLQLLSPYWPGLTIQIRVTHAKRIQT